MGILWRLFRVVLTDTQVNEIVGRGATCGFTQAELDAMCRDRGFHDYEPTQTEDGIVDVCLVCGKRSGMWEGGVL